MTHLMFSQHHHSAMPPPQKPETFMLSSEAQQSLPQDAQVALQQVDNSPVDWTPDQYIRRFLLPTGEYVSCVLWNNLFHISGTDIVRCLSFRFQAFGRPVKNSKKFEEGIFSDLRNLKSGTDASLEEPKSGFLDFLYKNNCIRTQKKQKVFYWYSVPHDRLFLDALERDLKREKMGQEATTVAVSEPALSFQFDSSQSLFEQLTKAQQTNSSSFSEHQSSFAPTVTNTLPTKSPVLRSLDSMPPPQMMPLSIPDELNSMGAYYQMTMPSMAQKVVKRETDFARTTYNQNGLSGAHTQPRHSSLPAYALEYSPTPSFVSSHYDDYSNRAISFEPITPPQQSMGIGSESAYIANEDTGLYSAIPEHMGGSSNIHSMLHLPPSNLATSQFSNGSNTSSSNTPLTASNSNRGFPPVSNAYAIMEGTPNYKQRRRRSSIPPGAAAMIAAEAAAVAAASGQGRGSYRPSDLRRSVSASVGPIIESDMSTTISQSELTYNNRLGNMSQMPRQRKDLMDISRQETPLASVEDSPSTNPMSLPSQNDYNQFSNDDMLADGNTSVQNSPSSHLSGSVAAIRRARSATMMDPSPYPHKSHSCPIPTCGRLFKRLEHLKRHVRTHTQERPYICPHCNKAFSRSDNLAQHRRTHDRIDGSDGATGNYSGEEEEYEGEDNVQYMERASPISENGYLPSNLSQSLTSMNNLGMNMSMSSGELSAPSELISNHQLLQQSI